MQIVVKDPSGNSATYTFGTDVEVVQDDKGVYHLDISFDEAGTWRYRWIALGEGETAEPGSFEVFANPLEAEREAAAFEELKDLVAFDEDPQLTEPQLLRVLKKARRPDAAGLAPSDPNWTPTYNLDAAAAAGWRLKAGKASPKYTFAIDSEQSAQSDVFKHCMEMAKTFDRGESGSARVASLLDDDALSGYDPANRLPL